MEENPAVESRPMVGGRRAMTASSGALAAALGVGALYAARQHELVDAVTWLGFAGLAAAWALRVGRAFRRADDAGLSWRGAFGRTERAPWAEVVDVRGEADEWSGRRHEVELRDGRVIRCEARWPHADALVERVGRAIDRGAYRTGADADPTRATFRSGGPFARRLWRLSAVCVAGMLAVLGLVLWAVLRVTLASGDIAAALFYASFIVGVTIFPVWLVRGLLRQRRAWRADVVEASRRGLLVQREGAAFRVPWGDVRAVTRRGAETFVETTAGEVPVAPGMDMPHLFLERVWRETGLCDGRPPRATPEEVLRTQGLWRQLGTALIVLPALFGPMILGVVVVSEAMALATTPTDRPIHHAPFEMLVVAGVSLLGLLLFGGSAALRRRVRSALQDRLMSR